MPDLEELRRITRAYRESAPVGTPPELLESIRELDAELDRTHPELTPGQRVTQEAYGGVTREQTA